jgi:hypothetical protein
MRQILYDSANDHARHPSGNTAIENCEAPRLTNICKFWAENPEQFTPNPFHHMQGLHT